MHKSYTYERIYISFERTIIWVITLILSGSSWSRWQCWGILAIIFSHVRASHLPNTSSGSVTGSAWSWRQISEVVWRNLPGFRRCPHLTNMNKIIVLGRTREKKEWKRVAWLNRLTNHCSWWLVIRLKLRIRLGFDYMYFTDSMGFAFGFCKFEIELEIR